MKIYKYRKDLTNKKFGKLTVLKPAKSIIQKGHKYTCWLCQCKCGRKIIVWTTYLTRTKNKKLSCGCYKKPKAEKYEASINKLYSQYKSKAKKRNLDFKLTKKEFVKIMKQNCYYCDEIPKQYIGKNSKRKYNGKFKYNGIDRINNKKGYIKSNCIPCCGICNKMKSNISYKKFMRHVKQIYKNKKLYKF